MAGNVQSTGKIEESKIKSVLKAVGARTGRQGEEVSHHRDHLHHSFTGCCEPSMSGSRTEGLAGEVTSETHVLCMGQVTQSRGTTWAGREERPERAASGC